MGVPSEKDCEFAVRSRSSRPHYIHPDLCSTVDRERTKGDARAVEDPIAAIFDLAESVDRQTPKIRKTLRYVRWFVSVWLLLDFVLIILSAAAFGGAPGRALVRRIQSCMFPRERTRSNASSYTWGPRVRMSAG